MKPPPTAAVIVPVYNGGKVLAKCLEGLLGQVGPELEIIVVDDGSTDTTPAIAQSFERRGIKCLRTTHRGAAAARNCGTQAANPACQIILFTDADCVPTPDWAQKLIERLEKAGEKVAGVGGVYITAQRSRIARFSQTEFEERYQRFKAEGRQPDFADTYSAAYHRELLQNYPFDEELPGAIVEDAELGWRLRRAGYTFLFEPDARVFHSHPESALFYFRRKFRIARWRALLYKNYPGQLPADSHTSQLAKVQMVLLTLFFLSLAVKPNPPNPLPYQGREKLRFNSALSRIGVLALLGLQLSYLPFARRCWRTDKRLALTSFYLLNLRTLAYTSGAIVGLIELLLRIMSSKNRV